MSKEKKNVGGRPREHDREQIAIDMVEWAAKSDSINLCKFCALYSPPIPPCKITTWAKEDPEFRKAYEVSKMFLGFRREEWLNAEVLHVKAYDLNAETYDHFLKDEKRQKAEFESSLNEKKGNATDEQISNFSALMAQFTAYQEARSASKMDNIKIKADDKS